MQFKYSTLVDRSEYDMQGLCDDALQLRINNYADFEEIGTFRAQEDWRKYVGPLKDYRGGLGPKWCFMSIAVPECLPERLEIISYANEFAFLYDDITDNVSKEEGDEINDQMMDAFLEGAENGTITGSSSSGKKYIQAKMLQEMLKIDKPRALVTMKSWGEFVKLASGRQHFTHFKTLEEYLPYRVVDVGEMFWVGMMTFGMALTIPEEDMPLCRQLSRSVYKVFGLLNDLFSWDKEYEASLQNGQDHVCNAIMVLMTEHNVSVDKAKEICKIKIKEYEAEYIRTLRLVEKRTDLCPDLKRYVEALQYTSSANTIWSITCPRYHASLNYNERQLSRMKNGVGRIPMFYKIGNSTSIPVNFHNGDGVSRPAGDETPVYAPPTKRVKKYDGVSGLGSVDTEIGVRTVVTTAPQTPPGELENTKVKELLLDTKLPELGLEIVLAPFRYLLSLPAKGVRNQVIDALNVWVQAPIQLTEAIKSVVNITHSFSLMLDDLEDSSPLRRGLPSTHTIFGDAQTVNSANFQIIDVIDEARKTGDAKFLEVVIDELKTLVVGQSYDLYWTFNVCSPSIQEYLTMVDAKTGSLFRLISRLLMVSSRSNFEVDLSELMTLFGRYFQIRDDYQNLVSSDYTKSKGFCEDLDEGKYSLPLIHALENAPTNMALRSMLLQRRGANKAALGHKELIIEHLNQTESLEFTAAALRELQGQIVLEVLRIERASDIQNVGLKNLLEKLHV